MDWKGSRSIYSIILLFLFLQVGAQEAEQQDVDSLWWKSKTEQLDYTEDDYAFREIDPINPNTSWINSPLVMYTILFLIVAFLLFTLYKLFGKDLLSSDNSVDVKEYKLLTEEDLEDRFYEMDLDEVLKKALDRNDWKMAIRIQFLILLKTLINDGQIKWNKDLTNFQIVYQLKSREGRSDMRAIVRDFELVWYGDKSSSKELYKTFEKKVNALINTSKSFSGR